MMASRSALDENAMRVAMSPINLRETCILLMQSAPDIANKLQTEIRDQRQQQGPLAEDYLGLNLSVETIGKVIAELTAIGKQSLIIQDLQVDRTLIKGLIDNWLALAEWILSDLEITDDRLH